MCYAFDFLVLDRSYTILSWLLKKKKKKKRKIEADRSKKTKLVVCTFAFKKAMKDLSGCMWDLLSVFNA